MADADTAVCRYVASASPQRGATPSPGASAAQGDSTKSGRGFLDIEEQHR